MRSMRRSDFRRRFEIVQLKLYPSGRLLGGGHGLVALGQFFLHGRYLERLPRPIGLGPPFRVEPRHHAAELIPVHGTLLLHGDGPLAHDLADVSREVAGGVPADAVFLRFHNHLVCIGFPTRAKDEFPVEGAVVQVEFKADGLGYVPSLKLPENRACL